MKLNQLTLEEDYRTGFNNLVEEFYRPCLESSNYYFRSVGYFSSSVFLLVGPEFIRFAQRGGRFKLVCSPKLSPQDIEAIEQGYNQGKSNNTETVTQSICEEIESLISQKQILNNTEALATLIVCGALEVKIAFNRNASGMYHEKLGLFCSSDDSCVVFKGSVNETWNGWHERGNYESMDVFCSWREGRDRRQTQKSLSYFGSLWDNEVQGLEVIDFPKVSIEKLQAIAKDSVDSLSPNDVSNYFKLSRESNSNADKGWKPFEHQSEAIENWKKQNKRGILEHATGSGKTFTAMIAIKEHLSDGGVVLVLVPDKLLHEQWSKEIKFHIENISLLKVGAGNTLWKKDGRLKDFSIDQNSPHKRVILATVHSARSDDFINFITGGNHLMIVADEVHEIGSKINSNIMKINSGPRLGLSATPKRYGDEAGTKKILEYFGGIVKPPFTLIDAINSNRLVKYQYYPSAINLNEEESDEWEKATNEILVEFAKAQRDDNNKPIINSKIQIMLIQRSRIAKKAAEKVPYALSVIKDNYQNGQSWLIYCEDQYQLNQVMQALKNNGYDPLEYHINMTGDANASLYWFKTVGGIMVSIRCLDQGVDIPKISNAIILASSQNPRQFIQRRGRVLRVCKNKHYATIYDAIVVPTDIDNEPGQLSLLKSELQRSIEFSGNAINKSGGHSLVKIAIDLGIDPNELNLYETAGIEEEEIR